MLRNTVQEDPHLLVIKIPTGGDMIPARRKHIMNILIGRLVIIQSIGALNWNKANSIFIGSAAGVNFKVFQALGDNEICICAICRRPVKPGFEGEV